MRTETTHLGRRVFIGIAGTWVVGCSVAGLGEWGGESGSTVALFDGKTLDGWTQIENSATSLSSSDVTDQAVFINKLASGQDAVSIFLRGQLEDAAKADLAIYSSSKANAKAVMSALVKDLNQIISGP